jgi:hypothetical protein
VIAANAWGSKSRMAPWSIAIKNEKISSQAANKYAEATMNFKPLVRPPTIRHEIQTTPDTRTIAISLNAASIMTECQERCWLAAGKATAIKSEAARVSRARRGDVSRGSVLIER